MDPFFISATALIVFAILMVAIASSIGRNRARSAARVEALLALVAESSSAAPRPTLEQDDDWDLGWGEQDRAEVQPADPAEGIVAAAHQFVVRVPDAPGEGRSQVSFERKGSRQ